MINLVDLPILDDPFTMEEIDAALKDMPSDHAPGPDDFNGHFFKKCWPIIKDDFIRLCTAFSDGNLDLKSINSAFIVHVRKKG